MKEAMLIMVTGCWVMLIRIANQLDDIIRLTGKLP